ncbi:MAG: bifunctional folylpolyglutamate synthase/dihydrofolate synthase [bacterium]|nr:MAG: bifunctional folylpolyglutamate synthase/dihydrofolate synthase [bacterium]
MFEGKTYKKILKELYGFKRLGIRPALPPVKALLRVLGNPHKKCRFIHIAGTNGKGSTVAMIASILKEAGFYTGAFYSPHLSDYAERIRINGQKIPQNELVKTLRLIGKKWTSAKRSGSGLPQKITFFEWTAALAFCYFAEKGVEVAVVETGMGGRFDATNVLRPLASAITNISLEHTAFLGKTRAAIAAEKAAIIKTGRPVVAGEMTESVTGVFRAEAHRKQSRLFCFGHDFRISQGGVFHSNFSEPLKFAPAMAGRCQLRNAAVAAQTLLCVKSLGIKAGHIVKGISKAVLPGRFEIVVRNGCEVIYDAAHNPAAFRELARILRDTRPGKKFNVVMGILRGKDYRAMLKIMAPLTARMICITPDDTRAVPAGTLLGAARAARMKASTLKDTDDLSTFSTGGHPLLVTGSFTTLDAVKKRFTAMAAKRLV